MPATPVITFKDGFDALPPGVRLLLDNGGSTIARNLIYRRANAEHGGAEVLIASVGQDGAFDDYELAHNTEYTYRAVAVDGSGNTASSATVSVAIALNAFSMHAVTHALDYQNAVTLTSGHLGAELFDQSHDRRQSLESALRQSSNATLPTVDLSPIAEGSLAVTCLIPQGFDVFRRDAREVYLTRALVCLRTMLGDKLYGRLEQFREAPIGINFLLSFTLELLDFSESVE